MTEEDIKASQEADDKASREKRDREATDTLMSKIVEMLGRRNPDGSLMYREGVPKGKVYGELSGRAEKWRPFTEALQDDKRISVVPDGPSELIVLIDNTEVL